MASQALRHGGLRVVVTGGRYYDDRDMVFRALDRIDRKHGIVCVIHGQCMMKNERTGEWEISGADKWADEWAEERRKPCSRWPVAPGAWKAIGKRAGPERTERMIEQAVPDLCVALPGGTGTAGCVAKCRERGILVYFPETNEVT